MRYLAADGNTEMTKAEFEALFGPCVIITRPDGPIDYVVDALQDSGYDAPAIVEVLIEEPSPPPGVWMRLSWPGDQSIVKEWKSEPQFPWPFANAAVVHLYFPDRNEGGPYTLDLEGATAEKVSGVGLVAGTNHRHVRVYYQKSQAGGSEPQPGTEPEPTHGPPQIADRLKALYAELGDIITQLEKGG